MPLAPKKEPLSCCLALFKSRLTNFNNFEGNIMQTKKIRNFAVAAAILASSAFSAHAQIIISEVDPAGSVAAYAADWFELTNIGSTAVSIIGWKMDDNSNGVPATAEVALRGVTSIAAGQSVVFIEGNTTGTTDAAIQASFISAWFGSNVPAGFAIGGYGGAGVGLSQTADAVNIFDASGILVTRVDFNTSVLGKTFDNAAGLNNTVISQLSALGVNGAFVSANGIETGSPGIIATPVPEPESYAMLLAGMGLLGFMGRRRKHKESSVA
jgi:hypothetical protein